MFCLGLYPLPLTPVFKTRQGMARGMRWEGVERNHEVQSQTSRISPLSSLEELLTTQCDRFSQEEVSGGGVWEKRRDGRRGT